MDRGFAGVVAVAVLGCAVVLAIVFQISEGLTFQRELLGDESGIAMDGIKPPPGAARVHLPALAVRDETGAAQIESAAGRSEDESAPADPSSQVAGPVPLNELPSAALQSRSMPLARQGMPAAAKEINPDDGHTVSPQPADEIEERGRITSLRPASETRPQTMTANDPDSSGAPAPVGLGGTKSETASERPAAVEMIRGTRRSSERIATEPVAAENQD